MDSPFIYNSSVSGKHFTGRKNEITALCNLLRASENVAIYDIPRAGITSLLNETFIALRSQGENIKAVTASILPCRSSADIALRIGEELVKAFATTPDELKSFIETMLPGSHFIFDSQAWSTRAVALSTNWDLDEDDIRSILTLPFRLASEKGFKLALVVENFQNIMLVDGSYKLCKMLESVFSEYASAPCSFIMTGSQYNAMKDIFDVQRFFYRQVELFPLMQIEDKDISDFAVKGFQLSGKVIEKELVMGVCKLMRCHIGYISHMMGICDYLSKGYINETVMKEALASLIAIHEPQFISIMNGLTTFQVRLLKAIVDGNVKFSSSETIEAYGLNSSANVKRLKDALVKKEIVSFDANDNPTILDPLFEYWVTKFYFEK